MGKRNKLIELRILLPRFKGKYSHFFSMSWKWVDYRCLGIYKKVRWLFSEHQRSPYCTLFQYCGKMTLKQGIQCKSLVIPNSNDKCKWSFILHTNRNKRRNHHVCQNHTSLNYFLKIIFIVKFNSKKNGSHWSIFGKPLNLVANQAGTTDFLPKSVW